MNEFHRDSLDIYCQEMSNSALPGKLSPEETKEYFTRYRSLRQELSVEDLGFSYRRQLERELAGVVEHVTSSCLPYVVKLAQDFAKGNSDKELLIELIAAGNEGLCKAVDRFKPEVGTPFHYYASTWIKAHIRLSLKQHHNLIKNAPANTTSVYVDGLPPGAQIPSELQESCELFHENDLIYIERRRDLRDNIRGLSRIEQFVFNLCSGMITESSEKYTAVSRMFGVGFSTAFIKSAFQSSLETISTALLTESTSS